ncbi:hypothetical protein M404DRAFT_825808 [Pisolithus tinctorius Marx 270]|uniref:ER membrane protein complex subunit 7 beta-sandwich domain-containing protein n=1 Tax=Pisolithus tinctorius Marx 270 TaxID=870435 RepID=A0A0C3JMY6_PISTI|nr:hypothetical protein M404DRAFT_825808 [Pisolithus tinctorius Marx 270]
MRSGNFSIPDVHPGVYVLSVLSHDYTFEQFRVDVSDASSIPEVKSYIFGAPLLSPSAVTLPYPIILSPRSKNSYFKPHESFSLLGMFRNPMMMLMLVTAGMLLAMPYIMKNLDPRSLEEIKNRREMVASIRNSVQGGDLKSGYVTVLIGLLNILNINIFFFRSNNFWWLFLFVFVFLHNIILIPFPSPFNTYATDVLSSYVPLALINEPKHLRKALASADCGR